MVLMFHPYLLIGGQLIIELKRGTSVLNIQYLESDKKIIKPVMEKISSEYKKYSGRR